MTLSQINQPLQTSFTTGSIHHCLGDSKTQSFRTILFETIQFGFLIFNLKHS